VSGDEFRQKLLTLEIAGFSAARAESYRYSYPAQIRHSAGAD
jgi:hypothetical protein